MPRDSVLADARLHPILPQFSAGTVHGDSGAKVVDTAQHKVNLSALLSTGPRGTCAVSWGSKETGGSQRRRLPYQLHCAFAPYTNETVNGEGVDNARRCGQGCCGVLNEVTELVKVLHSCNVHAENFYFDVGVDKCQRTTGRFDLAEAGLVRLEEQPVHVGHLHPVVVKEQELHKANMISRRITQRVLTSRDVPTNNGRYLAHAATRQHLRGDTTDAAHADDNHGLIADSLIVFHDAHALQGHETTEVALKGARELGISRIGPTPSHMLPSSTAPLICGTRTSTG